MTCKQCGRGFVFSVRDQVFYSEKGFLHEPLRCRMCRAARAAFVRTEVICAGCGRLATVPFKPIRQQPVYCRTCYRARRRVEVAG